MNTLFGLFRDCGDRLEFIGDSEDEQEAISHAQRHADFYKSPVHVYNLNGFRILHTVNPSEEAKS
jgi:hypothetical protein